MRSTIFRKANLFFLVCLLPCFAGASLWADEGDPPGRVARVSYLQGTVSLQPSGENDWSQATLNYTVTTGDRLYTDQGARVELEVGPFAVRMSEETDLTMANLNDQMMQLGIGQGSIRITVYDLPAGNSVEIATPNGALTILQPGSYRVDTDPNGGTMVSVNEGSLQVSGGGADVTVESGQAVQLTGTDSVQATLVALPGEADFDQWCASRDGRIRSFRSREYVSPDTPGAEDLDAYGTWSEVPEYGPVWYPAGVAVGWVPYRFGHWVWISPWGWSWVEDEPWGFCPFHYGRWALIGSAWGWVPGPVAVVPVYAPALVVFAGGGGFSVEIGVQAWFPLGPREPFFPWYHHGDGYLRQVNVTNVRVTNITNIINVRDVNEIHYVNRGAVTAVSTDTFRNGQPVTRGLVRVPPEQIARLQVVPHPEVTPTKTAAFGGRGPVAPPVIRSDRVVRRGMPAGGRPAPIQGGQPARVIAPPTRNAPNGQGAPSGQPARVIAPPTRNAPNGYGAPSGSPNPPTHFVTRTPPPPHDVPFSAKEPALAQHPGRPLEPQQTENLRAGKPAGPMQDKEFPPHESNRESKPAPRPKEDSRSKH
ncbi:MAG TPA: DUF6600 domain-containing protein [Terriglobia bacterium]|nr:DUF6600 domain-containing protein [Terriglobia bacterium]